jgi:NACalpha-BTF3-like transcription factor
LTFKFPGENALPRQTCLDKNSVQVTRPCLPDERLGVDWGDPTGECSEIKSNISALSRMANRLVTPETAANVTKDLAEVLQASEDLSTDDVKLVADTLAKVSKLAQALTANCIDDLALLMDGVLKSSNAQRTEIIDDDIRATNSILTVSCIKFKCKNTWSL